MDKIIDLPKSLSKTLTDSDLSSMVVNGVEIGVDRLLADGIIRDIPIISTLVSIVKTTQSISNYLSLKKMISFLNVLADIPIEKRQRMIEKIDTSKKYRNKVGEQLLFILDHCEDNIKAEYISFWFKAYINEEIDYKEFLQGASVINRITVEDFQSFIDNDSELYHEDSLYIGVGLLFMSMEDVVVKNEVLGDWDDEPTFTTEGGKLKVYYTNIGEKIRRIFKKRSYIEPRPKTD